MKQQRPVTQGREAIRTLWMGLVGLVLVGLCTRLAALPFATIDGGDPVSKVWIAQRWLADPGLITSGVWGPLHTYLLAVPLSLFTDPVVPPVLLHVLFGVATVVPLVLFTRSAFADPTSVSFADPTEGGAHGEGSPSDRLEAVHAALFVGAVYLFYPIAFSDSLLVSSETPFVFFLVLCLVALARARTAEGGMRHAVAAGLALTLAGMLRYEGWMLIPIFAALLWRTPKRALVFVAIASLHPVVWMIGNAIAYGDPLYSVHFASYVEIVVMRSVENLPLRGWLRRIAFQPLMTFFGMTPVLGGLAAAGAILALRRRDPRALWLFPPLALLLLLTASTIQGSLTLKAKYTLTVGTLLVPFAAIAWQSLRRRFRVNGGPLWTGWMPAAILTVALMLPFAHSTLSPIAPGYDITPVDLVPGFWHDADARAIGERVRAELARSGANAGFMTDADPRTASYYIAWLSRRPAPAVYIASSVREPPFSLTDLREFLAHYPEGLLLLNRQSLFAEAAGLSASDTAALGGIRFVIEPLRTVRIGDLELELVRYETLPSPGQASGG